MEPQTLIMAVADWAQRDDRVLAAGVCGSYARGTAGPDSDIDICIVSAEPESMISDVSWLDRIWPGARVSGPQEDYGLVQSLRVFHEGLEVEFGITAQTWMELPIDAGTAGVMNDGLRILYDPERKLERALAHAATLARAPRRR